MKPLALILCLIASPASADVAFLAAPRDPAAANTSLPTQSVSERNGPYVHNPSASLMLLKDDGSEVTLIDGGVQDFSVSLDGKSLLVTRVLDVPGAVGQPQSDIYKLDLATKQLTRLTDTPHWECQAVEAADCIAYLSNEDGWVSPHDTYTAFTVYRMTKDGKHSERIWHAGIGGIFGLALMPNGRLIFSTGESQGFHGGRGVNWSIWSVNTDGSKFKPESSATAAQHSDAAAWDFPCITSDGSLIFAWYYDTRIYGTLVRCPLFIAKPHSEEHTMFGSPLWSGHENMIAIGYSAWSGGSHPESWRLAFQRRGMHSIAPWAGIGDYEMRSGDGAFVGMLSHPASTPDNGVLCTWTGDEGDAKMNLGVYAIADVTKHKDDMPYSQDTSKITPRTKPAEDLTLVVDREDRHEWMGRPVVPFQAIYGVSAPPVSRGEVAEELLPGSPYAIIGTSGVEWNEWVQGGAGAAFAQPNNPNKLFKMAPDEAEFVRVLAMQPNPSGDVLKFETVNNGSPWNERDPNSFGLSSEINEVVGWYGDPVPLKKYHTPDGKVHIGPNPPEGSTRMLRSDGKPDNSWAAEVPGNQVYSLQLLNANGEAIEGSTAQTWHATCPREKRTDCQGCHAHHEPDPVLFSETWAARPDYPRKRLKKFNTVVYERDIAPLDPTLNRRPWDSRDAGTPRAYSSSLNTLDDDLELQNPILADLYRKWQDTGWMAAANRLVPKQGGGYGNAQIQPTENAGPYADTMEPTATCERFENATFVGACDPNSGVASVLIEVGGQDVTSQFTFNADEEIYSGPAFEGDVTVTVTDKAGLETKIVRTDVLDEPAPTPHPEPTPREPAGVYLGMESDQLGDVRGSTPNGKPDHHIKLTGLDATRKIAFIDIKAGDDGDALPNWKKWSTDAGEEHLNPPHGVWWWIKQTPRIAEGPTGEIDLWFSKASASQNFTEYRVYVVYDHTNIEDRDFIRVAVPAPDPDGAKSALPN